MEERIKYPIGQQDFKTLRQRDCLYVDKTPFVDKIVNDGGQYYFLARPRRFGKSLFLSTLRYFFEGRRDLFKDLYIDSTNWDWREYPVLYLDLNVNRYEEQEKLDTILDNLFTIWEEKYEVTLRTDELSLRFRNIIAGAHQKTGLPVVILVDEYDKPLVGNLNKDENFGHYRSRLASLYSNFKSSAEHIGLVFLTGVSRFSKLNVFSDLNNIRDITFSDEYADICGITEEELYCNFQQGIEKLAVNNRSSYEEACKALKDNYDGYRFAKTGSEIYNPWSVLNAMADSEIGNYWNATGIPTIVAESLKRVNADLKKVFDVYCGADDLRGLDLMNPRPVALMYQTGYLTIKDYNRRLGKFRLGIPNREVKNGLFNELLPYYVDCRNRESTKSVVSEIITYILLGRTEDFMHYLQVYFSGISYKMRMDNENNFHNAFFLLMDLIGLETETEVSTSDGSIDILVKTREFVYIIELKYDGTAQAALDQINEKRYARPFGNDGRRLFKIGVNFSSKTRCIEDWKIEQE